VTRTVEAALWTLVAYAVLAVLLTWEWWERKGER
jgi:hypothetical protein